MTIDLRTLDEPSGTLSETHDVQLDVGAEDGGHTTLPCRVKVDYSHSGGAWHFHVSLDAKLDAECHRCLDPVSEALEGEFDLVVRRSAAGDEHAEESDNDEFITIGLNQHEVALDDLIHENLVVNVPMLILCGESCKGLCPSCGVNRNRETCQCEETGDARWDALKKLAGNKDEKE